MPIDASELYALSRDFGKVPAKAAKQLRPIFNKTALEVKKGMQADFRKSRHFKQVAGSVDYELTGGASGGNLSLSAEVGPNASTSPAAPLAGIAYFGGSNGGGGTVRDPIFHARDQGSKMVGFIEQAMGGLL
jgi:hypothetical protein